MPEITVDVGHKKYPLHIERGGIKNAGTLIKKAFPNSRAVIISDENVFQIYGETVAASLIKAGMAAETIVLSPGEGTKSFDDVGGTSGVAHVAYFF